MGLLVLGPERLPRVAAKVGRWAGQARQMARNLQTQLRDEIEPVESSIRSVDESLRKDFSKMRPDVGDNTNADGGSDAEASANDDDDDDDNPGAAITAPKAGEQA